MNLHLDKDSFEGAIVYCPLFLSLTADLMALQSNA